MWLEECQRQIRSIYNSKSKVKIIPWDQNSAVHIDEIHTQLSWLVDDRKPSGVTQEKLQDYTDIFSSQKNYPKPKRILVYGRPGVGKTAFTQKTTFDWSQKRNEMLSTFDLVLLVKLRDVCDLQDVPAILRASELLASDGKVSVEDLYKFVVGNQEKVLLILDGYDEYSAGTQSPVRDIWERKQLRDCCVILTTRQIKADELRRPSDAQFEINGFDSWDQIKEFALKFLKDEEKVLEFYRYLVKEHLTDVAKIPLLLTMLCLVWMGKISTGPPTSRADIYQQFIQTLLNHMSGKDAEVEEFSKVDDYTEELCQIGKLAFDALVRDSLYLPFSDVSGSLIKKLIEVGLFQVSNLSSLNPDKGVFFIHKSVQEFLSAWYLKDELLSRKGDNSTSLTKLDSIETIFKMSEVLKFASELSGEAAWQILRHMGIVAKREGLTEYDFEEVLSQYSLYRRSTYKEMTFIILSAHVFFCCSLKMRRDLFPAFLSHVGGVLSVSSDQLHTIANEHLLKSTEPPNYIIFARESWFSEQEYYDLITVLEDVNAVVVSCSGEKKASDFLRKCSFRGVSVYLLKKEENMHLYIGAINNERCPYLGEMLKELIASPKSIQQKAPDAVDQAGEQNNRTSLCLAKKTAPITLPTRHCLSVVIILNIYCENMDRSDMEMFAEFLPSFNKLRSLTILGEPGEALDAQLAETLVSCINFTDRLDELTLSEIILTAESAAVVVTSLHKAPNLTFLDFSWNPLSEGVSVLIQHLSSVPRLKTLYLECVEMTKKQVYHLTTAIRQSKITTVLSAYHVTMFSNFIAICFFVLSITL